MTEKDFYTVLGMIGGSLAIHLKQDHGLSNEEAARKVGDIQNFNARIYKDGRLEELLKSSFPKIFTE